MRTVYKAAFQPAIPVSVLSKVLLVIIPCIERIGKRTRRLRHRQDQFGRLPVDATISPPVGLPVTHKPLRPHPHMHRGRYGPLVQPEH
jgi:hypothetical protein